MLKGFRDFISKGNVLDLAVAVVLGAAFTAVINAVVKGLIDPFIAAIFGKPNLDDVGAFTIHKADFSIGLVLTAALNFVLVAAAVYFLVIVPYNKMRSRYGSDEAIDGRTPELKVLEEIRDTLQGRASS